MASPATLTPPRKLPRLSELAPSPYAPVGLSLTAAQFKQLSNSRFQDYELIDGELTVAPPPEPAHQWVEFELARLLGNWVSANNLGRIGTSRVGLELGHSTLVQPDIVFVQREHPQINDFREPLTAPPALVIEVLSPSTARRDLDEKFRLYQAAGVPNYWIVDHTKLTIDAWTLKSRKYARVEATKRGKFSAPPFAQLVITLADIWPKPM